MAIDSQLADNPEQRDSAEQDDTSSEALEQQAEQLDKLGMALSKYRSDAIEYRTNSGIENEWVGDREHYEGIDDSNRGELGSWDSKPLGQGALQDSDDTGSTVFFNITRSYCDTASSRVGDMLLPTDDKGWSIAPTPIPDSIAVSKGELPPRIRNQIESQVEPDKVEGKIAEAVDKEKQVLEEAREKAEKASKRIEDWHVECQYNAEMRKVIEESSIIGSGVLKGPIPENRKRRAYINGEMVTQDDIQPVSLQVQAANCYPDPSCGMDIQNGSYHWERDDISRKKLSDLKNQGYDPEQVDKCLKEGPFRAIKSQDVSSLGNGEQMGLSRRETGKLFEIWYFYGRLENEDLIAAGLDIGEDEDIGQIDVHVVMVNNRVLRAARNHMESGEFPYDYMVWQSRAGMPWGIGVSRQIRVPQRVINGAGRNLMDNAGMAGGPMVLINTGLAEPADGDYEIVPRKVWFVGEDAEDINDVRAAFSYVEMPMMQADLQAIIQLGMEFAEQVSGLPSLLQGQQQNQKETLGGQQMRRNDGSSVLRRIARQYDDKITTPHIRRYYDWIMIYGEDEEKGDFVIKAKGSSALVERDIQTQSITDLVQASLNPAYGLDPKKAMAEWLQSQRLPPENFEYDDEEWQGVVEQMSAPPQDSSVQIAQMKLEFDQFKLQAEQQFKAGEIQNKNEQDDIERGLKVAVKEMESQVAAMEIQAKHAGAKDINIDSIKADMAKTIMTLKAQLKVSADGTGPEVATPVVEPEGRARDDRAFQE